VRDQVLALLRGQVVDIMVGTVFLFFGLSSCAIAAARNHRGARIFIWLGIWSAMYGAQQLTQSSAVVAAMPGFMQAAAPYANTLTTYLLVVVGLLAFLELSLGTLRRVILAAAIAGLAIAVVGIIAFVITGSRSSVIGYNNALAAGMLLILTTVVGVPGLSSRCLALPDRRVLTIGTLVFTVQALYNSLSRPLGYERIQLLDHLGFAVLLFSFAYVALQLTLGRERKLLSVESELSVAREIQTSILPAGVPRLEGAVICATYRPMTAVAGDLYEFIPVDERRLGFLVADVCGHGVPAALIASMVKIAVDTVTTSAKDPQAVLRGLNRLLSTQARGQLVSAAYLWLDTENRVALYSAAGHPPLMRWRDGTLERIESNGILFGILPGYDAFPVATLPVNAGDRFILYTDGVIEAQNANGEFFGDGPLERVIRRTQSCSPAESSERLFAAIREWQPAQQDDITLIVIDIV